MQVFQFPGFCLNGAIVAWVACQRGLSDEEKNQLCALPPAAAPDAPPPPPLGQAAGVLGPLGPAHPLVVSLQNLRRWYTTPGMGEWLHGLRLFSLTMNGYTREEGAALAERNHAGLARAGVWDEE